VKRLLLSVVVLLAGCGTPRIPLGYERTPAYEEAARAERFRLSLLPPKKVDSCQLGGVRQAHPRPLFVPHVAENGSYFGEISAATGRPKTVFVDGYYRKDGTYVRSHYRALPRGSSAIRGPPVVSDNLRFQPKVAENGSYYGETSVNTGRPKTVHVRGYHRKDGTYVRGHYRSKPRK